jgi:hypothetical protein
MVEVMMDDSIDQRILRLVSSGFIVANWEMAVLGPPDR